MELVPPDPGLTKMEAERDGCTAVCVEDGAIIHDEKETSTDAYLRAVTAGEVHKFATGHMVVVFSYERVQ